MFNFFLKGILGSDAEKTLALPIIITQDDYIKAFSEKLNNYYNSLETNIGSIINIIEPKENLSKIKEDVLKKTKMLINGLITSLSQYNGGNITSAFQTLSSALHSIGMPTLLCQLIDNPLIFKLESVDKYYRIRKNMKTEDARELYHIPYNKLYVCKDDRFNYRGYPCLYLSLSKEGCKTEMDYKENKDTLGAFNLNNRNDTHLRLLNLTEIEKYYTEKTIQNDRYNILLHILWPLFASCYCIWEVEGKEYSIEYILPQMFAQIIRNEFKLDGILYYTVKNTELNPQEDKMKNIILFTTKREGENHDMGLLNHFNILIVK